MGIRRSTVKTAKVFERGIERALRFLAEIHLARRVRRLIRSLGDDASAMRPEPWELVRSICAQARRDAVYWSNDEAGYPTSFNVLVAREAWGSFYGYGTESKERRVAEEVGRQLSDCAPVSLTPLVSISCDETLPAGEYFVRSSFWGDGTGRYVDDFHQNDSGTMPRDEPAPLETIMDDAYATVLATSCCDGACLLFKGASYPISAGTTIGAPRHRERPGIALPIGRNDRVSGIHGKFLGSAGDWEFEQIGHNGTLIEIEGEITELLPGERIALAEGAKIYLPNVDESVTFTLEQPSTLAR